MNGCAAFVLLVCLQRPTMQQTPDYGKVFASVADET